MTPLYQYADHEPPRRRASSASIGPRSKNAISFGCDAIRPVEHRDAALIPRLHHDVAARDRNQRAVVRDAVLLLASAPPASCSSSGTSSCRSSSVKIASAPHSCLSVARQRGASAAPLVGEQHLRAVVVERRRVPEREVGVGDGVDALRVRHVADVEQQAVAAARAAGEPDRRIHGDVVALVRAGRRPALPRPRRRRAPGAPAGCRAARRSRARSPGCARQRAGGARRGAPRHAPLAASTASRSALRGGDREIVEDARRADDRRLLGSARAAP